jgi:hypothetical protein
MERNDGHNTSAVNMAELLLPEAVRRKAAVSVGGEHAWRQQDVEEVLQEARAASLGCLSMKASRGRTMYRDQRIRRSRAFVASVAKQTSDRWRASGN